MCGGCHGGCHGGCSEFKHVQLTLPIADAGGCQLAIHNQTAALTQNLHPVSSFSNHNLQPHCSITVARFPHLQRYGAGQLLQDNRQADIRSKRHCSGVVN